MKYPGDAVVALWCFAESEALPRIASVAVRYRISYTEPTSDALPDWGSAIQGRPCLIGMNHGEFDGPLGWGRSVEGLEQDETAIEHTVRRKHPQWSAGRIRRAVQELAGKSRRARRKLHASPAVERWVRLLRELASNGPVTLVLDDGGVVNPHLGGTCGLPSETRHPRFSEAVRVRCSAVDADFVLSFPYWIPVTISA